ncbi:MAG: PilZ domain-containing protein [Novosphingobium sp.]|nr:PilZ domain-containing protein [Novosphingobium sp.]
MSARPASDQRRDSRQTLMLRTAKVICQSGEYVCLVRDVSRGGVGLRFFHAVPQEPRIFLELANGALYPIERTWQRSEAESGEAGYRFAAPVALGAFLDETSQHPHRPIRLRLKLPVLLTVDGTDCKAMLADISRCGAKLTADRRLPEGAFVRCDALGLPLRFGHVAWRRQLEHGIVFQQAFGLEELARCLFALQPALEGLEQEQPTDSKAIRAA